MTLSTLSHEERTRRLGKMLKQIAPESEVELLKEDLQSWTATESLESFDTMDPSDAEFAVDSLDSFISGGVESIDEAQAESLEAIVHRQYRPALYVVDDSYRRAPSPWNEILEGDARKKVEEAIPSVGRIDILTHLSVPYAGTGFIVADNLLMTNRHVANLFVAGEGDRVYFTEGQSAIVDLKQEQGSVKRRELRIVRPVMIHPYWDMALLEVDSDELIPPPLRLSTVDYEDLWNPSKRRNVVVIGYPAKSPHNDYHDQARIFGQFEVKRLQPGVLRKRRLLESYARNVNAATHDCSTLGGNSGSALLDIESGEVVGLHFAGIYMDANFAVPTCELARDSRVVQSGINFAGPAPGGDNYARHWDNINAQETSAGGRRAEQQGEEPLSVSAGAPKITGGAVQITIPLHVTVELGQPQPTVADSQDEALDEGLFGFGESEPVDPGPIDINSLGSTKFDWDAALASAKASQLVYEDGSYVESYATGNWSFSSCKFINIKRTQCFIAFTQDIGLVCFRGTKELNDWLTNLGVLSTATALGSVHSGFLEAFDAVASAIQDTLDAAPRRPIVITGHSLGGALATIAGGLWKQKYPVSAIYTFGQPAVGKGDEYLGVMRRNTSGKMFRFRNDDDVVATLPPLYSHVGQLFHFDRRGELKAQKESMAAGDVMMTEKQFEDLKRQLESMTNAGAASEGFVPSVADHGIGRYIEKIADRVQRQD